MPHNEQQVDKKWNVVITKTIAGTVSQQKIDEMKAWVRDQYELNPNGFHEGIWNIHLTPKSPDKDYAKYLMLIHETIEEEELEIEVEDVEQV